MSKNKLSRANRKAIQAAIAKANRKNRKEKSAQDSIPFQRMWADSICRTANNHYTTSSTYSSPRLTAPLSGFDYVQQN